VLGRASIVRAFLCLVTGCCWYSTRDVCPRIAQGIELAGVEQASQAQSGPLATGDVQMIDSYSFGSIVVDGQEFTADLIITSNHTVHANWWRKEGHVLHSEDLEAVFADGPEVLVVGMGKPGLMRVADDARKALRERGIDLIAEPTPSAVLVYNELLGKRRVAGAFHLTC